MTTLHAPSTTDKPKSCQLKSLNTLTYLQIHIEDRAETSFFTTVKLNSISTTYMLGEIPFYNTKKCQSTPVVHKEDPCQWKYDLYKSPELFALHIWWCYFLLLHTGCHVSSLDACLLDLSVHHVNMLFHSKIILFGNWHYTITIWLSHADTDIKLKPDQNCQYFADNIWKCCPCLTISI